MNKLRVRVFREERREKGRRAAREKKKKEKRIEKMSGTGPGSFYISARPGRFRSDPASLCVRPLDLGFYGSGLIPRL